METVQAHLLDVCYLHSCDWLCIVYTMNKAEQYIDDGTSVAATDDGWLHYMNSSRKASIAAESEIVRATREPWLAGGFLMVGS